MNQLKKLLNLGIHDGLTQNEQKLVKLLNLICVSWYGLIIAFVVLDAIFSSFYELWTNGIGHGAQFLMLMLVQYLHYKRKITAARLVFLISSMLQFFAFCNLILPGKLVEFYYLIILIFSLLFLHKRSYHLLFLFGTLAAFFIPNHLYHFYGKEMEGNHISIIFMFLSVYLLVNYFKTVNQDSEKLLEEQKNEALNDKHLIEKQKKELEDLHSYQNQFFVNVAHEIRTPLTIIKGNTSKLNKQFQSIDKETVETLQNIELQNEKIQEIVNSVLDLAKIDANTFVLEETEIEINQLVQQLYISFTSNFQNKGIAYHFIDNTTNPLSVKGDLKNLERAINNIILNALKYCEKDSEVTVDLFQETDSVRIEINDTGIGIANDQLDKIFNRFYQVNNSVNRAGGSGIGLAFSKEIIQKHKGKITVKSTPDVSTCFTIELPTTPSTNHVATHVETPQDSTQKTIVTEPTKDQSILLVEDNTEMRSYLKSVLNAFTIHEATNGLEGLEVLKTQNIDFIITDYMMPQMDGYEFISAVKKEGYCTPILMLTARTDFEGKLNVLQLGIDDYITKPFEEAELLIRINNALQNHKNRTNYLAEEPLDESVIIEGDFSLQLQEFIENNCKNNHFGIPDICDQFALSTSSLYRKVKCKTGLSPKEFITEVRLQKARKLLLENHHVTAKDLATEIGYTNYSHFSNIYFERFGKQL